VASDALCVAIQDCHARSRGTYGSPRIHADLIAHGIHCSRRRPADGRPPPAGLPAPCRRARAGARGASAPARALPAPDLVRRAFAVSGISRTNHVWVADTTAIRTGEGWLHLAVVIDLRSRRVVGWGASAVLDATLTGNAVRMALHRRRPARGQELVHHSDRGSTYTARAFQALLRQAGITCSMGRPGTCLDNAVAETFFATLKVELIHRNPWPTRADGAGCATFRHSRRWLGPRRHGSLGNLSPVAFEASQPSAPSAPKPLTVR
jgi:transposase InsO family protein